MLNKDDQNLIRTNDFEWYGAPNIKEYSNSDTLAYFYFTLYVNNEEGSTLFTDKELPNSKGLHYIIPKQQNPKYVISEKKYYI